jgi:hypothetical protein
MNTGLLLMNNVFTMNSFSARSSAFAEMMALEKNSPAFADSNTSVHQQKSKRVSITASYKTRTFLQTILF